MSWETTFARRVFRKDPPFLAKRKLRTALWAMVVGAIAAALVVALVWHFNNQRN